MKSVKLIAAMLVVGMLASVVQAGVTGTIALSRNTTVRTINNSTDWYKYGYPVPAGYWRDRYDWAGNAPGLPDCFLTQKSEPVRTTITASQLIPGEEYAVWILFSIRLNSDGVVMKDNSILAGIDNGTAPVRRNETNSTSTGLVSRYENATTIYTVFEGYLGTAVADPNIRVLVDYYVSVPAIDRTMYHGLAYARTCEVLPVPGDIQATVVYPTNNEVNVTPGTVSLSWEPADSNCVSQSLYYFVDDMANFKDNCGYNASAIKVDLSNTADTYNITADYDQYVMWRVDTVTDVNALDGTGTTWVFKTTPTSPLIDTNPVDVFQGAGSDAVFAVQATNPQNGTSGGLSYQWYKAGSPNLQLSDGSAYAGTATNTLTVLALDIADEGDYFCRVTLVANGQTTDSQAATLTAGWLIAHYAFDGNANDSSTYANNGVWPNPALEAYNTTSPVIGSGAVIFVPNIEYYDNYIDLGTDAVPNAQTQEGIRNGEGSASCWFKTSSAETMAMCGIQNSGSSAFWMSLNEEIKGRVRVYVHGQDYGTVDLYADPNDPNSILDDQWHHAAFTWSEIAEEGHVYLDGKLLTTEVPALSVLAQWQYPMLVGARNNVGTVDMYFDGELDELKIYNYALTMEDVGGQYIAGPADWVCQVAPEYDLDDNCIVDIDDLVVFAADRWMNGYDLSGFAALASEWLECGLYPQEQCTLMN